MPASAPNCDLTKCAACSANDKSLMLCTRCRTVKYCGKECQKSHWKSHKPHCGPPPSSTSSSSANASRSTSNPDTKPFTAIHDGNYLHNRNPEKTYQILIDCLRLRQEDVYKFEGDAMDDTIYDDEPNSEGAFRTFIAQAQRVRGFLPPWWNDNSLTECIRYSRQNSDFSLACAREKGDIQELWKDHNMPMKLRMLGEKVYGNTPGGSQSAGMLGMQMAMEGGGGGGAGSLEDDLASANPELLSWFVRNAR